MCVCVCARVRAHACVYNASSMKLSLNLSAFSSVNKLIFLCLGPGEQSLNSAHICLSFLKAQRYCEENYGGGLLKVANEQELRSCGGTIAQGYFAQRSGTLLQVRMCFWLACPSSAFICQ